MKELVIISGKGGTGKTSVTASLAVLAKKAVMADCDVDAADLHLILKPEVKQKADFYSGREAIIRPQDCIACGICEKLCRFDAINKVYNQEKAAEVYEVKEISCEGCGVCVRFCPEKAIDFPDRLCGEWMISDTRCGPMVHAQLGVAAENSGKLVSQVREEAQKLAKEKGLELILVDGPPGIGCPVIASLTGVNRVLVVTEPTLSGKHDLKRVMDLCKHFEIHVDICINKWDLQKEISAEIEKYAQEQGARVLGKITYDPGVTKAQLQNKAVVEIDTPAKNDIIKLWENLNL